jgi:hypothetical protein
VFNALNLPALIVMEISTNAHYVRKVTIMDRESVIIANNLAKHVHPQLIALHVCLVPIYFHQIDANRFPLLATEWTRKVHAFNAVMAT